MNPSTLDHSTSELRDAGKTSPPELARAHWVTRLRQHLTIAFVAKVAMLVLLYVLFFPAQQRPHIDAEKVARHFLSPR